MRTWPALVISRIDAEGDLLLAALADHTILAIEELSGDTWRVFFPTPPARDAAHIVLGHEFTRLTLAPLDVSDDDWAARSQAELRAVRIGRLIVAPPWDIPAASPETIVIVIQPSMGFGTGHHATTRLCLAALQRFDLAGLTVLDAGTGSGVLAIAASLLGASGAAGIDDDPDAIQCARENAALNEGARVTLDVVDLRSSDPSPADVVVANLTGGALTDAAELLQTRTRRGGKLILSGILRHEEDLVVYAFNGCEVEARLHEDEWRCVVLRRCGIP